jgi:hypothetical protein
MNGEGVGIQCQVKYAKLVKWQNDASGLKDKTKPPLQVLEKFGEEEPFIVTFQRGDFNAFAQ